MKKLDFECVKIKKNTNRTRVKMWGRCGRDHVLSLKYLHNQILLYEKEYTNLRIFFTLQNYTLTAAVV